MESGAAQSGILWSQDACVEVNVDCSCDDPKAPGDLCHLQPLIEDLSGLGDLG